MKKSIHLKAGRMGFFLLVALVSTTYAGIPRIFEPYSAAFYRERNGNLVFRSRPSIVCTHQEKLTLREKDSQSARSLECLDRESWKKLPVTVHHLSVRDQELAPKDGLEALRRLTEIGVGSYVTRGIEMWGPFLPRADADFERKERWAGKTNIVVFRIEHRAPCHAQTEHTVQIQHPHNSEPLKYTPEAFRAKVPRAYYCIAKKVLYSAETSKGKLGILPFQTALPQSKKAIRERARHSRAQKLAEIAKQEWVTPGEPPPEGRYFNTLGNERYGVRGRFQPVFEDNRRVGFRHLEERYEMDGPSFVIPHLDPCDEKTEYTVRKAKQQGYFCALKTEFEKVARLTENLLAVSDLVHCSEECQIRVAAIYEKRAKAEAEQREREARERELIKRDLGELGDPDWLIDPFKYVPKKKGPKLRVYRTNRSDCKNCYVVRYYGRLYDGCGNFCADQGYSILIGPQGKVIRFIESSLIIYNANSRREIKIPREGLKRIIDFVNEKNGVSQEKNGGLAGFFRSLKADRILAPSEDYSARWSKRSQLWGAGNTLGTFVLHMGFVRKELKLGDWPQYDWSQNNQFTPF